MVANFAIFLLVTDGNAADSATRDVGRFFFCLWVLGEGLFVSLRWDSWGIGMGALCVLYVV